MNRKQEKRQIRYTSAKEWAEKQDEGFKPTSIKLPDGVSRFSIKKEGNYVVDVIPFIVGQRNPNADEGFVHYERTFYVHRGMGVEGKSSYCCLSQNFGKKCPVCDFMKAHPDQAATYKVQMRQIWLFMDNNATDKGIQVFDSAYYKSFGEALKNKITTIEAYGDFFKLDGGYTLHLKVAKQTVAGFTFNAVVNIEMFPRKKAYDEEILDQVPCLDNMLIELSYKELKAILDMEPEEKDVEKEKVQPAQSQTPSKGRKQEEEDLDDEDEETKEDKPAIKNNGSKKKKAEEPDSDSDEDDESPSKKTKFKVGDLVAYKGMECEVKKITKEGLYTVEDEDEEDYVGIKESMLSPWEPDEEEEEPKSKKSKKPALDEDDDDYEPAPKMSKNGKSKLQQEEEEELDEDDDEEEEPTPKKKRK